MTHPPLPLSGPNKRKREFDDSINGEDDGYESASDLFVSHDGDDIETKQENDEGQGEDADDYEEDEDEDQSEDEDDEDEDEGYSEKFEPWPKYAACDPEFSDGQEKLGRLASKLLNILENDTCDTPDVRKLRGKAQHIQTIPAADRPVIGLIGNSGQGAQIVTKGSQSILTSPRKSSFINSITDIPGLANAVSGANDLT